MGTGLFLYPLKGVLYSYNMHTALCMPKTTIYRNNRGLKIMQQLMSLQELLIAVQRQTEDKRDYVVNTRDNVSLVLDDYSKTINLVLLKAGASELERFRISEHAHNQIGARLKIPRTYYSRLLADHPDLIVQQVNALFEREPESRLFRTLDGQVRAFLSDSYKLLDNDEVLSVALPPIVKGDIETTLLSSHVDPYRMDLKVLFTDDRLAHEVAKAHGEPRIIRPGFRLSNSEIGAGKIRVDGFFYDSYCTNGCVFGSEDVFTFSRSHRGSRLTINGDYEVISDQTRKAEDQLLLSQINDSMQALSDPKVVESMANTLREKANTPRVQDPIGAVEFAAKEFNLTQAEHHSVLETFLRDQDYTQFGLASAITEVANKENICSASHTSDIEDIGGKLLSLSLNQWEKFVKAESEAKAA